MKKILLVAITILFSTSALADVSPACTKYFEAIDSYIADAEKKYGSDASAMSEQFAQAKDMVKQLPKEHQDTTCNNGISALEQARQAAGL